MRLSLQYPALEAGVRQMLRGDGSITVLDDTPRQDDSPAPETADVHIMTSAVFARAVPEGRPEEEMGGILVLGGDGLDPKQLWALSVPWGALPLEVSAGELCAAVRAVAAGLVVGTAALMQASSESPVSRGPLTEREVEILAMLSRGLANKQVAAELGISEHTVKFHVSSIYTKLNVANRTEAVREGLRNGWIAL